VWGIGVDLIIESTDSANEYSGVGLVYGTNDVASCHGTTAPTIQVTRYMKLFADDAKL